MLFLLLLKHIIWLTKPTLQQRHNSTQEKQPDTPSGRPEATSRTLSDGAGIESVVDDVLQIFTHSDLSHQSILVTVHTGELANVRENILEAIR